MSINKIIASGILAVSLFAAPQAFAQSYYAGCVNLTSNLSVGSRNSEVSTLQRFLVAQNYPGGGSWMVTGYFGNATRVAVQNFQQSANLPMTGWVDAQTRSAIYTRSCGGSSYPGYPVPSYPSYPSYPTPTYPYTCNGVPSYYPCATPTTSITLSYLTPTSASQGTSVTVSGNGFDYSNNTVYVGGIALYNIASYNGTSLSFTVPSTVNGTVSVTVSNSRGSSNALTLNVYGGSCNTYPYNNNCCTGYSCTSGALNLTSLSQTSGNPGTSVTIYGNGFDYSGNTVYLGSRSLGTFTSTSGTAITVMVPSDMQVGTVQLYVSNSRGTSNSLPFSVTYTQGGCGIYPYNNCNNQNNGSLQISYLSPSSGGIGSTVTVVGSGFTATGNSVRFGNGIISNLLSSNGTSITFTVPSQLTGFGTQFVGLGVYNVSVTNGNGATSNAVPFTVTSVSGGSAPTITSVTGPFSLAVGTQGTWTLQLSNPNTSYVTSSVNWGDQYVSGAVASQPQTTYMQGTQTVSFSHSYAQSGTYTITFTVTNASGQQNTATATVTVGSTGVGSVVLNNVTPTSGRVGQQVVLQGSGFSLNDNTVRFGIGGTQHLQSQNGTSIYYTIPAFVSPCDLQTAGTVCAQYSQQIVPGPVQISVSNGSATSNVLMFQVTN